MDPTCKFTKKELDFQMDNKLRVDNKWVNFEGWIVQELKLQLQEKIESRPYPSIMQLKTLEEREPNGLEVPFTKEKVLWA